MIGDTNIGCLDIYTALQDIPHMTDEKARELLDPTDKQNVPKAVNLFQELRKLSDLPSPVHPAQSQRRKALNFFTKIVGCFLLPFISIDWSLSEQIYSLSAYAHFTFAMYRKHGTAFMTGPLYADSQAIVKNIVITLLRLQEVNPDSSFYIILEGTDRLEKVFSDCRTQDHSRNFDIHQLSQKLTTGAIVQSIFERNPSLDRGHRRLSLKDALGIDHINPHSWEGNVRVGDVDVGFQWVRGQEVAKRQLSEYFGTSEPFNFADILQRDGIDLLRPRGDWVGVQETLDDARTEQAEVGSAIESHQARLAGVSIPPTEEPPRTDRPASTPTTPDNTIEDIEESEVPDGLDVDDFFPDIPRDTSSSFTPPTSDTLSKNQYLEYEGKHFLKSSLVTALLTPHRSRKVTIRTLRARGVTLEDLRRSTLNLPTGNLESDDLIKSGDIAASLIRIESIICLAVVEILSFRCAGDKTRLSSIEIDNLDRSEKAVTVTVQVLKLEDKRPTDMSPGPWEWTGNYLRFGQTSETTLESHRQFTLDIPGSLVHPLGPDITEDTYRWSIPHTQLDETKERAWDFLDPESEDLIENVKLLPNIKVSVGKSLPYTDQKGIDIIISKPFK